MTIITALSLGVGLLGILSSFYWARKYFSAREALLKFENQSSSDEALTQRLEGLAAKALQGNAETFLNLAKSDLEKKHLEIENVLQPIRMNLSSYQEVLKKLEDERRKSYTSVEQELRKVIEVGQTLSIETSALKNALKKPHVRGRWGEVQLKNCIELAGMSEYCDVSFQDAQTDDDGRLHKPDMTVRMPAGRVIVVDAKTPLDAFIAALEATDDGIRAAETARHGRQLKDHVKKLSTRAYSDALEDSPDFTVLFLPNESFLYAALEAEPDLVEYALQKKILIATPPTLIGLLKVVRFGWNEERLAENAARISEEGKELHKRLCDFVEAYVNIGKHLDKAKSEYDIGRTRLQSRLIVQAERLESLGAKSHKDLAITAAEI